MNKVIDHSRDIGRGRSQGAPMRGVRRSANSENPITPPEYFGLRIGVMWAALRREPLFFWCFCGVIFVEYVRPQDIYPVLAVLRPGLVFLFGTILLRAFSTERFTLSSPLTLPMSLLFTWVLVSSVLSYYPDVSFAYVYEVVNWVLVVALFLAVVTTRFRLFIVVLLFLLASFKMAQTGALTGLARGFAYEAWGVGGPGWFGNAADLGVQMAIFTPLSVAFILGCRQYWSRLKLSFFTLFPVAAMAAALATSQRNTLLAFSAMGLLAIASAKKKMRAILVLAIVGAVGFSIMPPEYKARILMAGSAQDETSQSRLRYWRAGWETFLEHPVTGIGHYNWGPYMWEYRPGLSLRRSIQEVAHSVPVTVVTELGAPGFILYYTLIAIAVVLNRRAARRFQLAGEAFWAHIAKGLNFGFVAFLVSGVFLSIAWYPFLFMQIGFTATLHRLSASLPRAEPVDAAAKTVRVRGVRRGIWQRARPG